MSRRIVGNGYDGANRAYQVSGSYGGTGTTCLSGSWYWPHGAIGHYLFGNSIMPALAYNRQLQQAINDSPSSFLLFECYNYNSGAEKTGCQ